MLQVRSYPEFNHSEKPAGTMSADWSPINFAGDYNLQRCARVQEGWDS